MIAFIRPAAPCNMPAMRMTCFGLFAAVVTLQACGGPAPQTRAPATAAAPAQPPRGPGLLAGMGNHHHAIATSSAEAQQYFDQGFDLVFGFNHEEAARSFQRASELDPKAAMPYWGIAWALGPNYNLDVDDDRGKQAHDAMARALALSTNGPENERGYIEAMAIRFPSEAKPDRAALARKYADAMRDLSRRYPDDLDAATLYAESLMNLRAWKLWTLDGKPADQTENRCSRAIRITWARIITTFTRSRRRRIPDARSRAPCGCRRWRRRQVTSRTCPRTSMRASATRLPRREPTKRAPGRIASI